MNVEILGWLATVLLLLGYFTNAQKKRYSWLVWMAGNTLMGTYAYFIDSTSVLFLSIILIGLNLYGYNKWKADK